MKTLVYYGFKDGLDKQINKIKKNFNVKKINIKIKEIKVIESSDKKFEIVWAEIICEEFSEVDKELSRWGKKNAEVAETE
jgi:hypothetical protein